MIRPVTLPGMATRKPRRLGRCLLNLAGALVFLSLVLILVHVFTSKSLLIEIDPAADSVSLRGMPWPVQVRGRYLVRPGSYRLQARRAGYHPLDREIQVGTQASQSLAFSLLKLPGYLNISSTPEQGVRIQIDDTSFGAPPIRRIELAAGTYVVRAFADRYLPYTTQLVIEGGHKPQDLEIQLQPGWAEVSIDSQPAQAEVWLDGSRRGQTPLRLELMAGEYRLDLHHPDYLPYTVDFAVVAGQAQALPRAHLQAGTGHVRITSVPAGARVSIADRDQGQTPLSVALAPNAEHHVTLTKPGYRPSHQTLTVEPGQRQTFNAHLEALAGTVIVQATPEDAEVLIQGRSAGRGRLRLELPSAPQRLEVRKPGYLSHTRTIIPVVDAPQVIAVRLQPAAGPSGYDRPARILTHQGAVLIRLDGGTFSMGAPRREQGRRTNETRHDVTLQRPFYLAAREVTNAQFNAFMTSHHSGSYRGHDLSAPELPVVNLTWVDAVRYCNWLSEREGLETVYEEKNGTWVAKTPLPAGYRLPTESEWEWAARWRPDGKLAKHAWGHGYPPVEVTGNYADQAASGLLEDTIDGYHDGFAVAAPVGSFKPNPLGLFDLGGNVSEWCHDYHSIYPALSEKPYLDPAGPATGSKHVIRGASWMRSTLSSTRLSYRDQDNKRHVDVGFRIARYLD